jgi:hypothetical protein
MRRTVGRKKSSNVKRAIVQKEEQQCEEENNIMKESKMTGEGESGAQAKLKPHFILDLGLLFFLGLMVVLTTIFSL